MEMRALNAVGSFARMQDSADFLISKHLVAVSPDFGAAAAEKLERLTDRDRKRIVIGLAADIGLAHQVENFGDAFERVKEFRDAIGHGHYVVGLTEGEYAGISVMSNGTKFKHFDMEKVRRIEGDVQWLEETVYFLSDAAGYTYEPLTWRDGTLLRDFPPPIEPPRKPHDNRVVILKEISEEEAKALQTEADEKK